MRRIRSYGSFASLQWSCWSELLMSAVFMSTVCMIDTCRKRPSGHFVENFKHSFRYFLGLTQILLVVVVDMNEIVKRTALKWDLCCSRRPNDAARRGKIPLFLSNQLELLRFTTPFAIASVLHTSDGMWCDVMSMLGIKYSKLFYALHNKSKCVPSCRVNVNIQWY